MNSLRVIEKANLELPGSKSGQPEAMSVLPTIANMEGKLRIFLGSAPGAGKTYAMLKAAHEVEVAGTDVVIGLIEAHRDNETAQQAEGLEILPRRRVESQSQVFEELDLDEALRRMPQILLVDELAHKNPSGFRNAERWQDVEELLRAGITVWTAVNVEHIAGIAGMVAAVLRRSIRDTVPDEFIRRATEIVVVDVAATELLRRLRMGKIYAPTSPFLAGVGFRTRRVIGLMIKKRMLKSFLRTNTLQ